MSCWEIWLSTAPNLPEGPCSVMGHVALEAPLWGSDPEDLAWPDPRHLESPSDWPRWNINCFRRVLGTRASGPALECCMSTWGRVMGEVIPTLPSGGSPRGILHWLTAVTVVRADLSPTVADSHRQIQIGQCGSCSPSLSQDPVWDLACWPWRLAGGLGHYSS